MQRAIWGLEMHTWRYMKPPNVKFNRVIHHPPIIEKIFPSIPDDPDAEKVLPEDVDPNYKPKIYGGTGSSWESGTMDPAIAMKKSEEEYGWSPMMPKKKPKQKIKKKPKVNLAQALQLPKKPKTKPKPKTKTKKPKLKP